MIKISDLLNSGVTDNVTISVKVEDLLLFGNMLIERAREDQRLNSDKEERYVDKKDVKVMLGVCDATLWHWANKKYLNPVKIGNKVRYKISEITKLMEGGK